ncbi:hypothetical protein [Massilia endophytica]|uniref:hypothetical protein n=1 Tax=Massilia endophytica TaxID=2899220 RepID=UPI001E5F192A|nr:hypothetical protein [Massilia endophytica]UGQ47401.1 hypothetical protein LSQ66_02650 [Massilia endophytica]
MKKIFVLPLLALGLAGCASQPYYAQPANPYEWRTVSVTPLPAGTIANSPSRVTYTTEELPAPTVTYVPQPVYVPAPVYAPAPAYYYPPVSIGFDFIFSNHHGRGWGHRRWR